MKVPDHYLVIDFETSDPYIGRGYGSGWVFAVNHNVDDFKLLGAAVYDSKTDETKYYTDMEELKPVITARKTWVFFNAQYDVGCMLALFKGDPVFNLDEYTLIDTQIQAKLHSQSLMVYSLESVCEYFETNLLKDKGIIGDYVWDSGLYQLCKQKETKRKVNARPTDNVLNKWAIQNLELLPTSIVGQYCIADVKATNDLFLTLINKKYYKTGHVVEGGTYKTVKDEYMIDYDVELFSDLTKACLDIRQQGVRVDLKKAREASKELLLTETQILSDIKDEFGIELNLNSPYQLGAFLETIGVTNYPKTEKGNPSVSTEFLADLDNEWAQRIAEARISNKIRGSFIDKILKYQGFNDNINGDIGIMYLSLHILGATQTGRFTSGSGGKSSFELNIQQIPARHPELGKLCRSLFLPNDGEKWVHADFSSQESRIQVHYATKLNCPGAAAVAYEWCKNPNMSFHDKVAEITGLDKTAAKAINFGLSYGMGEVKLCESLGLPLTKKRLPSGKIISVAGTEAKAVLDKYHEMLPFMKDVITKVNGFFKEHKYVSTIGGRKLLLNPYFDYDDRKGFSKLIQGSAADQGMRSLVAAHKSGLNIINMVHDEINISSADPGKDAEVLRKCMEESYKLEVPMLTEVAIGENWGACK